MVKKFDWKCNGLFSPKFMLLGMYGPHPSSPGYHGWGPHPGPFCPYPPPGPQYGPPSPAYGVYGKRSILYLLIIVPSCYPVTVTHVICGVKKGEKYKYQSPLTNVFM